MRNMKISERYILRLHHSNLVAVKLCRVSVTSSRLKMNACRNFLGFQKNLPVFSIFDNLYTK